MLIMLQMWLIALQNIVNVIGNGKVLKSSMGRMVG